jgi:hypothetical protein
VHSLSRCLGLNTSLDTVRGIVVLEVRGHARDVRPVLGGQHSEVALVDITVSLKHRGWNRDCGLAEHLSNLWRRLKLPFTKDEPPTVREASAVTAPGGLTAQGDCCQWRAYQGGGKGCANVVIPERRASVGPCALTGNGPAELIEASIGSWPVWENKVCVATVCGGRSAARAEGRPGPKLLAAALAERRHGGSPARSRGSERRRERDVYY